MDTRTNKAEVLGRFAYEMGKAAAAEGDRHSTADRAWPAVEARLRKLVGIGDRRVARARVMFTAGYRTAREERFGRAA